MKDKTIRFVVTPYSLPKVILALHNGKVDFSVTQADGDLLVCIDSDKLMQVVYQLPDAPQDTEISGSDVGATPNKVYESPYDDRDDKGLGGNIIY